MSPHLHLSTAAALLLPDACTQPAAGALVDRDFVAFPAQIYKHWLKQPEVLERSALHRETGEPMPAELLERVLNARTSNQGSPRWDS